MEKDVLHVNLLGQFELSNSNGVLDRQALHSNKLMRLLSYIMIYRGKDLTVHELCNVIWSEGGSGNPAGALKNLMYRLRCSMKILGDTPFILTRKQSYCWNEEVEVIADFEVFDKLCKKAVSEGAPDEERLAAAEQAVALYKGPLPAKLSGEQWGLPLETYYHSCYLTVVKYLAGVYEQKEQYDKMEVLTSNALIQDGLDEQLHCNLVKALVLQDKQNLALIHYNKAVKQLRDNLGVRSAAKLRALYETLLATDSGKPGNLDEIYEDIAETDEADKVFMCEYAVFKEIYRLENRRLERLGVSEYILLISLHIKSKEEATLPRISAEMDKLEGVLQSQLRRGDVAAKYSDNQFIVLLLTCTETTAKIVAERVKGKFTEVVRSRKVRFRYELKEVTQNSSSNVEEVLVDK